MKTKVYQKDHNIIIIQHTKYYELPMDQIVDEKRIDDHIFTGDIIVYDYDARNNLKTNQQIIHELSVLKEDLKDIDLSKIKKKEEHKASTLAIIYLPLILLIIIFVVLNLIT